MNTLLEAAGITLVVSALIVLAVVAGSFRWEFGALVAAVDAAAVGTVLIVLANRPRRVQQ